MKILYRYLLILSFLSSFSSLSFSQEDVIRYATANLNLRELPSTSSPIIVQIPKGTAITLEEQCDCLWIPVRYNNHIGYIATRYLSKNEIKVYESNSVPTTSGSSRKGYYKNSNGEYIQSPTYYSTPPKGATALCRDGTYSFSQSRRGTCSRHGGVKKWL